MQTQCSLTLLLRVLEKAAHIFSDDDTGLAGENWHKRSAYLPSNSYADMLTVFGTHNCCLCVFKSRFLRGNDQNVVWNEDLRC
jgi:hypothetical protein